MRLFDDVMRTDPRPAWRLELPFEFYNRIDSPYFERVRATLESWSSRYPAEKQEGLAARFRAPKPDG